MKTLVLGAGATGGYLGAQLLAAGRDVTFLVRPATADRLALEGLQVRGTDGVTRSHLVSALTASELRTAYDLVIVAVRGAALPGAIRDLRVAVGPGTQVVPLLNGISHLDALVDGFGSGAVLGATARLAATLMPSGTVVEQVPGIALELGRPGPDGAGGDRALDAVVRELAVDGVSVTAVRDIREAMWTKWIFIATTTVLTCLAGASVGETASVPGGTGLAGEVVAEVTAVATAEGQSSEARRDALARTVSDPASRFVPSPTRELWAGRPVEFEVLDDLVARAGRRGLATPLLDAALVRMRRDDHERRPAR